MIIKMKKLEFDEIWEKYVYSTDAKEGPTKDAELIIRAIVESYNKNIDDVHKTHDKRLK